MSIQVMLAGKVSDTSKLKYPVLASPKLDGVRATIQSGVVTSRNDKSIPNVHVQTRLGAAALNGMDGELICGDPRDKDAYRKTMSAVMSEDGDPDVTFYVFDIFNEDTALTGFEDRLNILRTRVTANSKMYGRDVKLVAHVVIKNEADLLAYETKCLEEGFEGVMVRSIDGPYKFGRSTEREGYLLKLKRFADSEAVVITAVELLHNHNEKDARGKRTSHKAGKTAGGMLGAMVVEDIKTGVRFEIGTGFTEAQRVKYWNLFNAGGLKGLIVTYTYFPTGSKDKPRFPTFKGFRDKRDL